MDYFEGVVTEYLRADRSLFVNAQCCIQLNPGANPDTSGPHWYCDAVAICLKNSTAYLCETSYASPPSSLFKRISSWNRDWLLLREALARDSGIPTSWTVRPWLFVHPDMVPKVEAYATALPASPMPAPKVTSLNRVLPWNYRSWDRQPDND